MAAQQRCQHSQYVEEPHQQWLQRSPRLFLNLLTVLLIASSHLPPASSSVISVHETWNSELPITQMSLSLSNRLSPLTPDSVLQFLWHIKTGFLPSFDYALCSVANLVCDPNTGLSIAEDSDKKSTFDRAELFVGNQIILPHFQNQLQHAAFLPSILSRRFPFRSESLPSLLQMFRIPPVSSLADHMRKTLSLCEEMGATAPVGTVTCAATMEEMLQFATSRLGSSDVEILKPSLLMGSGRQHNMRVTGLTARGRLLVVNCRELVFPYAVFLCQPMGQHVQTVEVDLEGRAGRDKGIVQCRGKVCEWISEGTLLWTLKAAAEEQSMAWRNEKLFHIFGHTGDNSTNVWNVQFNRNIIKNTGDVNFNPVSSNNTSGNKTTTPASSQNDITTQTNDTGNATVGTGHSSLGTKSNLTTGSTNSDLTTSATSSQNPQGDSSPSAVTHSSNTSTSSSTSGDSSTGHDSETTGGASATSGDGSGKTKSETQT